MSRKKLTKVLSLVLVVITVFLLGQPAYAAENFQREKDIFNAAMEFKLEIFDEYGEVSGTFTFDVGKMNESQRIELVKYIEDNGINGLEDLIKKELFGMSDNDITNNEKIVVMDTVTKISEDIMSSGSSIIPLANGNFSKTSSTYRNVTCVNPNAGQWTFTCEFMALVTVNFKKEGNKITAVTGTAFNTQSMTYPFSYENVRILNYVASDGSTCGATANYDVYRYFEVALIPIKFTKNCVDNVIAYSADY